MHPAHLLDLCITAGTVVVVASGLALFVRHYNRRVADALAVVKDNHLVHQATTLDKTFEVVTRIEAKVDANDKRFQDHLDEHLRGRI